MMQPLMPVVLYSIQGCRLADKCALQVDRERATPAPLSTKALDD
jgi:hypothetical protein